MKRALVSLLLVVSTVAHAAPHTVMVLKSEGTADAANRGVIETHVTRLAKNIDGKVETGDITLSDAAAAAGCNAAEATCKDEILATFAVDEMVTTTVTGTSAGGYTVTVRRLQKGKAPKTAASTLPAGKPQQAKIDQDIGSLFGVTVAPAPVTAQPEPVKQPDPPPATTTPATTTAPLDPYADTTNPNPTGVVQQPMTAQQTDAPRPSRTLQKVGMGVGAGLVLLSFVMWTQASSKQDEIDNAPANTPADFMRLRDLESEADGLAGGGNLFFIAGVVVGGVSAYYYWKKGRQARPQTARVTPTVFPHGAGLVLSFGGGQ